jgi:hypothetical protein
MAQSYSRALKRAKKLGKDPNKALLKNLRRSRFSKNSKGEIDISLMSNSSELDRLHHSSSCKGV